MDPFTATNFRLPGIRSFITRCAMFQQVETRKRYSSSELVAFANEAVRTGHFRNGDRFPTPDEISKLTGASVVESLDAVTILIKEGAIRQLPSGQLSILSLSGRVCL